MHTETLFDALEWTSKFHSNLHDCFLRCSEQTPNERSSMLSSYLAEHEQKLAHLITAFKHEGDTHALNTWCNEYFDNRPVVQRNFDQKPMAELDADELTEYVAYKHAELIDLYKSLLDKAVIPSMNELLTELIALEEHEIMAMMQGANRLKDI